MKKYYSKIGALSKWTVIGSTVLVWGSGIPVLIGEIDGLFIFIALLVGAYTIFMASIYFNTYYQINGDHLNWVTGPIKGKIKVADITQIKRANSIWEIDSLIKPILHHRPLLLRYTKFDDFPMSPEDEKAFIQELLSVNPSIVLEEAIEKQVLSQLETA